MPTARERILPAPSTRWETIKGTAGNTAHREPWNKDKLVGQKAPSKLKDIWALRVPLQMEGRVRVRALFNLDIDGKLRGRDLVALRVRDVCHGDQVASRAIVLQHKTQRPVQFEIIPATRDALQAWIKQPELTHEDSLFPCRLHDPPHLGTRQCARILGNRVVELGLDRADYGTHSMRGTEARLVHRRTKNLRTVQPILGHSKLESTVTHHSLEVDDAVPFHSDLWAAARAARLCCTDRRTPWLSLNHRGVRPSVVFRPTPSVHTRYRSLRLPLASC